MRKLVVALAILILISPMPVILAEPFVIQTVQNYNNIDAIEGSNTLFLHNNTITVEIKKGQHHYYPKLRKVVIRGNLGYTINIQNTLSEDITMKYNISRYSVTGKLIGFEQYTDIIEGGIASTISHLQLFTQKPIAYMKIKVSIILDNQCFNFTRTALIFFSCFLHFKSGSDTSYIYVYNNPRVIRIIEI